MRYLGLDPGLRATGWGVIDADGNRVSWVADGAIHTDAALSLGERLAQLHRGVAEVIDRHGPRAAAVEETFVNRNPASTLKLGQARGAVITAAALCGLAVAEYAPNMVKKTVVGVGHADKQQVERMVRRLFPGCLAESPDAADALAVALCHALQHAGAQRLAAAGGAR